MVSKRTLYPGTGQSATQRSPQSVCLSAAARRPPSSDPARVQLLRPTATQRSARSAQLIYESRRRRVPARFAPSLFVPQEFR
jgi:hypothetical protein